MTLYIEACESGSMFENILEDNLNIYAVSAANSRESSWGTYCGSDAMVNGKNIGSCLGDLFSVNWMEDADVAKMDMETLQQQYDTVKKETDKSHVLQWGDLTWTSDSVGEFESGKNMKKHSMWTQFKHEGKKFIKSYMNQDEIDRKNANAVDSRDNTLHMLYNRVMNDPSEENHKALQAEIDHRIKIDKLFNDVLGHHMEAFNASATPLPTEWECYKYLIEKFEDHCGKASDYTLKYFKTFVAECESLKAFPSAVDSTVHRFEKACANTDRKSVV